MSDLPQILYYLESNKDRLKKEYHLTKIGVFGSLVKEDYNDDSDIDLIVEFEVNTQNLYTLKKKLRHELQSTFSRSVDICREKYLNPFFKSAVISEARYV
ncbi:nucleotidyltransferase family protein [Bacteroidota bacterium]